jgi:hypothetical protein
MRELNLCDKIIKLDRGIRFAGIVNKKGEVIEGGFKHGVEPLLNGTDEQQMYLQSLSHLTMLQSYSDALGSVRYNLTEHEKVTLLTFPLDDSILCLSAMPKANTSKIRDKVLKVLKGRTTIGSRSRNDSVKKRGMKRSNTNSYRTFNTLS